MADLDATARKRPPIAEPARSRAEADQVLGRT
jgi:hypothetical protein